MRLTELNALTTDAVEAELLRCCGSVQWARQMAAARPFATLDAVAVAGDSIWRTLAPADWLEAFAAHPRIGQAAASRWSAQEQDGVRTAADDVRARLAVANRAYEARFGYIFIVCATGRTAEDMLLDLERRLANDPDDELRVAAEEQRKIMQLRLGKLLDSI